MKLSTCLILKNEGKTIYDCLNSMLGIADEYIIGIDKTCTDDTESEVQRFLTDNPNIDNTVYKYDWPESFAKARNEGMDKASGDWILIMDGHEYFPDQWYSITENKTIPVKECLKHVKEKLPEIDTDEVFFMLYQQPFTGQIPNNSFMQPRIYRNGKSKLKVQKDGKEVDYTDKMIRYGRAAHNTIKYSRPDLSVHFPEVIIIHDAPPDNRKERAEQRQKMNVKQLKEDLKKNSKDTRALFYLGNTYLERKDFKLAINCFAKYLKCVKQTSSEVYQCHIHKALAHKESEEWDEVKYHLYEAIKIDCNRRDALLLLGDYYFKMGDNEKAIHYYSSCQLIKPRPSRMFSNGGTYTWLPHQQLARVHKAVGDKKSAIAHLRAAYNYVQNPGWLDEIKELSGEKKNIYIIDSVGSFTNDFEKYLKDRGYNVVKTQNVEGVLAAWADVIWCEWADRNATKLGAHVHKTVIRVHGYEAYANASIFNQIPFDKVKKVVFVAKHIEDKMKGIIPSLNGQCAVIPNGVDTDSFYIKETERKAKTVGYAGFMNTKKNPLRLASIIKKFPKMQFHLRVDWQDPFLKDAFEYETRECKNIIHHSRYDDLNDFWNQMEWVISFSDIESFSFNVAEAMACGCQPMIYDWKGAKDIWRKQDIFQDMPRFNKTVFEDDMRENRDYILSKYRLITSNQDMERVLVGE
jgi:glycosyltransferase involved in cell wall biosynthesis